MRSLDRVMAQTSHNNYNPGICELGYAPFRITHLSIEEATTSRPQLDLLLGRLFFQLVSDSFKSLLSRTAVVHPAIDLLSAGPS